MSNSAQTINDGEAIGTVDRVGGVRRSSSSRQVRKKINKKSPASKESWQSLHDAVVPKISNEKFQNKSDEDDSSGASIGDICRICHMGGFPPLTNSPPIWEWQNQTARSVDSQMSTLSTYAYLGPLISACNCRGTVGLVHAECLERWLTESGHSRCELCGHRYATKRVPRHSILRSVIIWFRTVIATRQDDLGVRTVRDTLDDSSHVAHLLFDSGSLLGMVNYTRKVTWTTLASILAKQFRGSSVA
ncbi:uncharacterized protein LOC107271655 isoform X6 [Cephus cinctus]|uniref:Uncharacterized protein LOC107271655 isoform X6 n=1 Tax=Cephus cinctus TaxID=211228 RepID=A0AAJ7RQL1_CEPCN|nr:uncharacterized protein LOC107271655 isoform X6 [Cephus cinctus]